MATLKGYLDDPPAFFYHCTLCNTVSRETAPRPVVKDRAETHALKENHGVHKVVILPERLHDAYRRGARGGVP